MVVYKFGGTSVQNAEALRQVHSIVASQQQSNERLLLVASATSGTTSELLQLAADAENNHTDVSARVLELVQRHIDIAEELITEPNSRSSVRARIESYGRELNTLLESIAVLNECTHQSTAQVVSYGELLSTVVIAEYLASRGIDVQWADARALLVTNDEHLEAIVDTYATKIRCESVLQSKHSVIVTQGFIGGTSDAITTTLGRGGSDASAAFFGEATVAENIVIWTDVSGVYSADPRVISDARPVPSLSFGEVRDLALYGAKVVHPDAIKPAIQAGIPVVVKNTFAPNEAGTIITPNAEAHGTLHAVTSLPNCRVIKGSNANVQRVIRSGNLMRLLLLDSQTLEHGIAVLRNSTEQQQTSIDVALAGSTCSATTGCLVVVTGPTATTPATINRITTALAGINVLALFAGVSKWATFLVVDASQCTSAIVALHQLIVSKQEVV